MDVDGYHCSIVTVPSVYTFGVQTLQKQYSDRIICECYYAAAYTMCNAY